MSKPARDLEARDAKLEGLQRGLTDAVAALVTSDDWRRAMEFAARFHGRSTGRRGVFEVREWSAR